MNKKGNLYDYRIETCMNKKYMIRKRIETCMIKKRHLLDLSGHLTQSTTPFFCPAWERTMVRGRVRERGRERERERVRVRKRERE